MHGKNNEFLDIELNEDEIQRATVIANRIFESSRTQGEIQFNEQGPESDPAQSLEGFLTGIAVVILYIIRPEDLWDSSDVAGTQIYEIVKSAFGC